MVSAPCCLTAQLQRTPAALLSKQCSVSTQSFPTILHPKIISRVGAGGGSGWRPFKVKSLEPVGGTRAPAGSFALMPRRGGPAVSPPLPAALSDQYAPMSSIKMQLRLLAHRVSGLQAN